MFFIEIHGQSFPGELLVEVSESKITVLFIFLYVEDNATFFWQGIVLPVCFLRKLWFWEKIHLKFVKPWEMKNLPWDREKGSETVRVKRSAIVNKKNNGNNFNYNTYIHYNNNTQLMKKQQQHLL